VIECCMHMGSFHIPTGKVMQPPCEVPLRTYQVVLKDEDVFADLRTTPPVRQNEVGDSSFDHLVGHLTQIIDGHDFDGQSEVSVRGIRASLAEPEVSS
jgi:hypothetical protein